MPRLIISVLALLFFVWPLTGQAITINPARLELRADPGKTITEKIEVYNDEKADKTLFLSAENFVADGENGTPQFTTSTEGLASWIQSPAEINIPAGSKITMDFSISVPKNAEPGGYFSALFFSTVPHKDRSAGRVNIGGKMGALVLLSVNGESKEKGGVITFATTPGKMFSGWPVDFYYRFNNVGNDRIKPVGTITVTNLLGWEVGTLAANPNIGNVLPNSIRKFIIRWGEAAPNSGHNWWSRYWQDVAWQFKHFYFGRYTADLHLSYGRENTAVAASTVFYMLPWQLLLLVVFILIVVGGGGRLALRRYNRWVIKNAHRLQ